MLSFGIINLILSLNANFVSLTGGEGGSGGKVVRSSSSGTSSWIASSRGLKFGIGFSSMGMFGIPDEPPCYILFGLILAKLPLINNNRLKEFLYRSLYGLLQHRVTIPYVSHVSEAPLSMGYPKGSWCIL